MKNTSKQIVTSTEKRQYVRPQLTNHGQVETLTQGSNGGYISRPMSD
jgi:hypothetical protein